MSIALRVHRSAGASRSAPTRVPCAENVPRGTFVSLATGVWRDLRRIWISTVSQSHRITVSQIPGFVGLWNRWIDSAGVSCTVSQLHRFTKNRICGTLNLWKWITNNLDCCCSKAHVTQVLKKCTISVKWREGEGVPIAFLLSAGRALSQLSQYDCAPSGVNSPQVAARACIEVLAHLCWDRKGHNASCSAVVNLTLYFGGNLADIKSLILKWIIH